MAAKSRSEIGATIDPEDAADDVEGNAGRSCESADGLIQRAADRVGATLGDFDVATGRGDDPEVPPDVTQFAPTQNHHSRHWSKRQPETC
jgi:hypothetical protein